MEPSSVESRIELPALNKVGLDDCTCITCVLSVLHGQVYQF